jgi:hypothetical protein
MSVLPTSRKVREKWGTLGVVVSSVKKPAARYDWAAGQPRAAVPTWVVLSAR